MSDTAAIHTDKLMARIESNTLFTASMAIFSIAINMHKYIELLTPTVQGIQSFPRQVIGGTYILRYRDAELFGTGYHNIRESIFL